MRNAHCTKECFIINNTQNWTRKQKILPGKKVCLAQKGGEEGNLVEARRRSIKHRGVGREGIGEDKKEGNKWSYDETYEQNATVNPAILYNKLS